MNKSDKIYIAGHNGMVGSSIMRLLLSLGYDNILTVTSKELDLVNQQRVKDFFEYHKPDYVVLAAAKVGGINANMKYSAQFIYDNLMIQNNVIHQSYVSKVKKLVFLGSSCIYPKECPQPMKEEYLLSGKLEPTNEGYSLAKIVGLKMTEKYYKQYGLKSVNLIPPNLYGLNDNFDLENCHVLSALIKRFIDAKNNNEHQVILWGTGIARREFMHVDDLAKSILFMLENYKSTKPINIGWGLDMTIKELANIIKDKTQYDGEIVWDNTKPDGMLRKCLDVTKMMKMGFTPIIKLSDGINQMIELYRKQLKN